MCCPGLLLCGLECPVLGIFVESPSHAGLDHREVHIGAAHEHSPQGPAILIFPRGANFHVLTEYESGEGLLGLLAKRLLEFWRVDFNQSHLDLHVAGGEHG